jgi:SHS2 domain-containing protein
MLFDVMLDLTRVKETKVHNIELHSTDAAELFLDWLRELLFLFSTQGLVAKRVLINEINPAGASLRASIHGETYEPSVHGLKIEIKTPTYHQYSIEEIKGEKEEGQPHLKATVIFDV